MRQRKARTVVIVISILIALIGYGAMTWFRFDLHDPIPWWDKLAMTYGGVFVVFLFFDEIGRQAARFRKESDEERPRPTPGSAPGQRAVVVPSPTVGSDELRLQRIQFSSPFLAWWLSAIDTGVAEVMALHGETPVLNSDGHVQNVPMDVWLGSNSVFPFVVLSGDNPVGAVVLSTEDAEPKVLFFYIASSLRRQRIGTYAMEKVHAFLALLGMSTPLTVEVSDSNHRAQRFFTKLGFVAQEETERAPLGRTKILSHHASGQRVTGSQR